MIGLEVFFYLSIFLVKVNFTWMKVLASRRVGKKGSTGFKFFSCLGRIVVPRLQDNVQFHLQIKAGLVCSVGQILKRVGPRPSSHWQLGDRCWICWAIFAGYDFVVVSSQSSGYGSRSGERGGQSDLDRPA